MNKLRKNAFIITLLAFIFTLLSWTFLNIPSVAYVDKSITGAFNSTTKYVDAKHVSVMEILMDIRDQNDRIEQKVDHLKKE